MSMNLYIQHRRDCKSAMLDVSIHIPSTTSTIISSTPQQHTPTHNRKSAFTYSLFFFRQDYCPHYTITTHATPKLLKSITSPLVHHIAKHYYTTTCSSQVKLLLKSNYTGYRIILKSNYSPLFFSAFSFFFFCKRAFSCRESCAG